MIDLDDVYIKDRWRLWQNITALRGEHGSRILEESKTVFPDAHYRSELESLVKWGYADAAGTELSGAIDRPRVYGITKAHLPAYIVVPEHLVSIPKQCNLLEIEMKFSMYNIMNTESRSPYQDRMYWLFNVDIHDNGKENELSIANLGQYARCGLSILEGLALMRDEKIRDRIKNGYNVGFPGSNIEYEFRGLPIIKYDEKGKFVLDRIHQRDYEEKMSTRVGACTLSKYLIASRSNRTLMAGASGSHERNR
jgi:hypothetical protein